jgi:PiT family inorganic phosphate transporter
MAAGCAHRRVAAVDAGFLVAVGLALLFAFTNGIHDASNAVATLVATRAATPLQAILLAAAFNLLGPLLVGAAVADTIGGIVTLGGSRGSK